MQKESLHIYTLDAQGNKIPFPSAQEPVVLNEWTYTAERMASAPTITATFMHRQCLDDIWTKKEFVEFGGERYYVTQVPTSSKDTEDVRYEHEVTLTSERIVLENVFFFDVVTSETDSQYKDRYRSNSTVFNFYGTLHELVSRLNDSLIFSNLYVPATGTGYNIVIDEGINVEEAKEISLENVYVATALQEIYNQFGVPYYWVGKTCHVGYTANSIATPFEYGSGKGLLSIEKTNDDYRIINRITGMGSSDNIPYYYPNKDAYGTALFETENIDKSRVTDISLSKVLSYNSDYSNSTYTLCKNVKPEAVNLLNEADILCHNSEEESYEGVFTPYMGQTEIMPGTKLSYPTFVVNMGYGRTTGVTYNKKQGLVKLSIKVKGRKGSKISAKSFRPSVDFFGLESYPAGIEISASAKLYMGLWEDDDLNTEEDITSTSEYTFLTNEDYRLSIFFEANVENAKLLEKDVPLFLRCDLYGSINYEYTPESTYSFAYGDNKTISYEASGITLLNVDSLPYVKSTSVFENGEWVETVDEASGANPAKIRITGRKWITPSSNLMPPIYRESEGAERFYNAINDTYDNPSGGKYAFNNLFSVNNPMEGYQEFEDIKPSIKGMKNATGQLLGEISDIAFDAEDSDVVDDNGDYVHSYFYVKLHIFNGAYGFNIFKQALESGSMTFNMTSGNCAGCEFEVGSSEPEEVDGHYEFSNPVMTDGNGTLLKVQDINDGEYTGDYIQKDESKYVDRQQDTSAYEVWVALKKETSTFGVVMPNATNNYKPKIGDTFVITNILMPDVYVTNAENELKEALIKYMSENNDEKFTFSITFSRIYLQQNPDIASMLDENARIVVRYNGHDYTLYVSSYTCKATDEILNEITVDVTDEFSIGQSSLRDKIADVAQSVMNGMPSLDYAAMGQRYFLSKTQSDTAQGLIKFLQGLQIGKSFVTGSTGAMIGIDGTTGQTFMEIDRLYVRLKAIFEELEIHRNTFVGGKQTISPGGGISCVRVAEQAVTATYTYTDSEGVSHTSTHECWRCYFNAEQEGEKIQNKFVVGDQCQCRVFNARTGTVNKLSNKYYWRLIVGVGEDYIDISKTDCDAGSDMPEEGDVIVQLGNRDDRDRQSAVVISSVDTFSPDIVLYEGIDSYSYEGKDMVNMGVDKTTGKAFLNVYGNQYVGDRDGNAYMKYDAEKKTLTIKGKLDVTSTIGDKPINQYIQEIAPSVDMTEINNLINGVRDDLQSQIDGAIETWFYEGVPTLTNAPANEWTTDEMKNVHLGDLYYDKSTGKAYRFQKDGDTYLWYGITDTDILSALEAANKAQSTADGKMKVFSSQPKDSDEYNVGDLWVNATYGTQYNNDILRANTKKAAGVAFNISHWGLASKYTDDSALNTFITEYTEQMQSYKTQLDGKVETYFYAYEPTTANAPANGWTTNEDKQAHAGDLFYNTSTGYAYRWTGTAWSRLKDKDITDALEIASKAQDTADNKRRVFMAQPTTPYDEGDLWINGGTDGNTLMVCTTDRATGSYSASDWVVADDAALTIFSQTVMESLEGIKDQIDQKAETWYQAADPSTSWTTEEDKANHKGDLWYNTSNNTTWYWNGSSWQPQNVPTEVFDKIDGKASIYVSKPSSYMVNDLWILEAAYTLGGVEYSKGELVTATATSDTFNAAHWTKKVKYTDDTKADEALGKLEELEYIKAALEESTTIDGGLILSSLIRLGYTDTATATYKTMSGISGIYDSSQKGGGIAAWYGGSMIDAQVTGNEGNADRARSLFRMDGTGYLADGKLYWDASGNLVLGSGIKLSGVDGSLDTNLASILNYMTGLNSLFVPVDKDGNELTYQEASKAYALKAKVGIFSDTFVSALGMGGNSGSSGGSGGASALYELVDVQANSSGDGVSGAAEGSLLYYDGTHWRAISQSAVKPDLSSYATQAWVTGQGYATQTWVTGKGYATVTYVSERISALVDGAPSDLNTLKKLADAIGINETAISNIQTALGGKADKATTLAGYGITDGVNAVTVTGSGNAVSAASVSGHTLTLTKGLTALTAHQAIYALTLQRGGVSVGTYTPNSKAATLNIALPTFAEILSKPTTLAGYGITDGVNAVSVTGSGNAVTGASVSGHTLTLTKGATYLLQSTFDDMFEKVNIGTEAAPKYAIKAKYGIYTEQFVSALGLSSGGSTGGSGGVIETVYGYGDLGGSFSDNTLTDTFNAYTINKLAERVSSIEGGALTSVSWDIISGKPSWIGSSKPTYAFSEITGKPTTLSGYGITDAYTKTEADGKYVNLTGAQTITGQKTFGTGLSFSDLTGTNARSLLYQKMADNDYFRIHVGGTATNAGYAEIATADDGNEPIYIRQYTGVFATLAHGITLMDASGNQTLNTVTATALKKSGGTSAQFLMADGSVTTKKTLSAVSHTGWTNNATDDLIVPTMSFMAYWNGAYSSGGSSNLAYCNKGAFGTVVTHAHSEYVTALGTSGNYLTWTRNGAANNITVPYATVANRPQGFSSMRTSGTWGSLNTANGYTAVCEWVSPLGGGVGFWDIGAATSCQIDGFFYQNEGKYMCLDTNNYASTLDNRYYTESEINTKLTNGSVTKVGTATVGAANRPIYLNAGVPTAGTYTFGNASGNAPISNGTVNANLNADMLDGWHGVGTSGSVLRKSGYVQSGTSGLSSYWAKVASFTWGGSNNDQDITLYMHSAYNVVRGIVHLRGRWNSATSYNVAAHILAGNLTASNLRLYYDNSANTGTLELWYNTGGQYNVINTYVISETHRQSEETNRVTLYRTNFTTVQTPTLTNYTSGSYVSIGNNAATATTLQTARTINGTSFNGSANITTSYWGTARSIYIADATAAHTGAAVSVNGSGNVTLKLPATITAALSGNATTATTLATARTLWGQSFNGSGNVSGNMTGVGSISMNTSSTITCTNYAMATTFSDNWSDGTNSHPWYGIDHRYPQTGVFSTTISDYFGLTLRTSGGYLSMKNGGNVGVGTTSPSYKLDVSGTLRATGAATLGSTLAVSGTTTLSSTLSVSGIMTLQGNESNNISNVKNANSVITTNAPNSLASIRHALSFKWYDTDWQIGNVRAGDSGTEGFGVTLGNTNLRFLIGQSTTWSYNDFASTGAVTALQTSTSSDMRMKDYVGDVNLRVEDVAAAPSIGFRWKKNGKAAVGTYAQYWEKLLPEAVTEGVDGYLSLQYGVVALLSTIAVARRVVDMEKRIKELERELRMKN